MNSKSLPLVLWVILPVAAILVILNQSELAHAAEEKPAVKVSEYAPLEDLVAAQKYFLAQVEDSLGSKEDYAEDTQERVKKNALVLAIVSMNLNLHDTASQAQTTAAAMVPLAIELAGSVKEYEKAKAVHERLVKATVPSENESQKFWGMIRGQGAIMKKTNELNAAIKRNLTPARFEKQTETLKQQTATMAAIGQATLLDTHEVKNPADLQAYEKYAVEFRTAAAELNKAIHAADQAEALKAFARMDRSCHTCHQKFDPPKK